MKIAAVIAECNPLHNNHARLLSAVRSLGFDAIVVILGSNFVQRGDVAVFDKWARCRALLACGADLVIEMPVCSTLVSAPDFARNGVYLADALGAVDTLIFGSECGDLSALQKAVERFESEEGALAIRKELALGKAYPRAVSEGLSGLLAKEGITETNLFSPNNILGMEYLRSGKKMGSNLQFQTISRFPCKEGESGATQLRLRMKNGEQDVLKKACPAAAAEIFETSPRFEKERGEMAVLSALRRVNSRELLSFCGGRDGLENAIAHAALQADSLEDLYMQVKSKRYAHARIRRIIFSVFLGLDRQLTESLPPYLRVLGMNSRGKEVLRMADPKIPLSVSLKKLEKTGLLAKRFATAEANATELARFFADRPLPAGREYTMPVIITEQK